MANVASLSYFAPILAFLIVFIVVFMVLSKTKMVLDKQWLQLFFSFLIATVFASATELRDYILSITPWFAMGLVSLFFILLLIAFVGKPVEGFTRGVGILFIVFMGIVFLASGFFIFSEDIFSYIGQVDDAIRNSMAFGSMLLIAASTATTWILVKGGKKG